MKFCLSFLVVELMRQGKSPQEACEVAIHRMMVSNAKHNKNMEAAVIALSKDGKYGGYATPYTDNWCYSVWTPTQHMSTEIIHNKTI